MSGDKINLYTQIDTNILELQLTQDANFIGKHNLSLTNYTNTAVPQIAAGSIIENNGTLFEFNSNETITGTPSDGATFIIIVPSTDTCTAIYTNTAPTWSDSKQGYYGTGATANYRYLEFYLVKAGASYTKYNYTFARDKMIVSSLSSYYIDTTFDPNGKAPTGAGFIYGAGAAFTKYYKVKKNITLWLTVKITGGYTTYSVVVTPYYIVSGTKTYFPHNLGAAVAAVSGGGSGEQTAFVNIPPCYIKIVGVNTDSTAGFEGGYGIYTVAGQDDLDISDCIEEV